MQGKIVSTVSHNGNVYVFTEFGYVYEMYTDHTGIVLFRLIARMLEQ